MGDMRKLLLVEHDRTIASLLQMLLATHGFELTRVDRASGIRAGVEAGAEAILLNGCASGENSFEVCQHLRRTGELRPIIMLGPASDAPDPGTQGACGVDAYLAKPFSCLELVARIEALLSRSTPRNHWA